MIKTAVRAPRANAIAEWLFGTVRRELLDKVLIVSSAHARHVLLEYEEHFKTHRPHRSLDQAAPLRALPSGLADPTGRVV